MSCRRITVTGKIHIGRNGKPGKCTADPGNCPFGGSNEHFENEEQAYEAEYAGAGVALTKTNGQLGRPMPEFDHNTAKFSIFRMDEGAKPETKNKGEYSELHALATCLSDREMIFNAGSEPFEITAVQAKNHKYKIVDEDGEKAVYLQDPIGDVRSEEHTSELQSRFDLVCRLLLEKKNKTVIIFLHTDSGLINQGVVCC